MSEKSIEKQKLSKGTKIAVPLVFLFLPLTVFLFAWLDANYYICSFLLILLAMIPFFAGFEKRKPQARELVTIAVMCTIAVASRVAFIMFPNFKPMVGIIMIAGMSFGAEAGFLVGAVSGFVSNFIFGQGTWTPWQMFAFGIAGFLAGLFAGKGIIKSRERVVTAIFGALVVLLVVGPLLDTSTVLFMRDMATAESVLTIYLSGLPVNAIHALATALTLFFLCRPITEKLDRIKLKYGMLSEETNEI
ncbi:MAG: ECF transporter S component [Lachnospiraceae bacterium]|nr:ECF transporter S component [Lachnospiraceae bacterium]